MAIPILGSLSSLLPEILVSVAFLLWTGCWWAAGHLIYLIAFKCDEFNQFGFSGCAIRDPIGILAFFISSTFFFFIARHVLNFLYKGELPSGEELSKRLGNKFPGLSGTNNSGKKRK